MKATHKRKVESRVALIRSLTLDDLGLPNRLRHKRGLDKSEINNLLVQLKMFFEQDIPDLLKERANNE